MMGCELSRRRLEDSSTAGSEFVVTKVDLELSETLCEIFTGRRGKIRKSN